MNLPRTVYSEEHEAFRARVARFLADEAVPRFGAWAAQGFADREFWRRAGEFGLLGHCIPAEFGGAGKDARYGALIREEMAKVGIGGTGLGMMFHADVVPPFILRHGTMWQKREWLPKMARGEAIGALGMTEPEAGSDVRAISTTAARDGEEWVLNGRKTYITNGYLADLVIVAARTAPGGAKGISLFLVETTRPGYSKSPPMQKLGLHYEDAAELTFSNVRVPAGNLLGEENMGFGYLMEGMLWERMQIALMGVAVAEAALERTIAYARERKLFGKVLLELQNTRFTLAECATEVQLGRLLADRCLGRFCAGTLEPHLAAMAKYWCTDLQGRVLDRCLQLHGGSGFILDNPIARAYADARVTRIYGGANEIMKEIVARAL